jgi:hypothetical protein
MCTHRMPMKKKRRTGCASVWLLIARLKPNQPVRDSIENVARCSDNGPRHFVGDLAKGTTALVV